MKKPQTSDLVVNQKGELKLGVFQNGFLNYYTVDGVFSNLKESIIKRGWTWLKSAHWKLTK